MLALVRTVAQKVRTAEAALVGDSEGAFGVSADSEGKVLGGEGRLQLS